MMQETDGPTITGFVINGTSGTISQSAGTIKITMPYGTDLTSLKPEITLQNAVSVSPASGTAVNLSSPVTYTVTAEDGTTKTYTVTATVVWASLILLFKIASSSMFPVSIFCSFSCAISASFCIYSFNLS